MSHLEPLNVAPVIIYIDLDEEFSIARWIEGEYWSRSDFDDQDKVTALMQRVREIHSLATDSLPELNLLESIKSYRAKIDLDSLAPELMRDELLTKAEQILSATDRILEHCLCHNDLIASNILIDDKIHFFDWEFSGVNSPLFELAVMSKGNNLNEKQQQRMLQGYFGERWEDYITPLSDWLWLYEYIALLWELAVEKELEEVTPSQQKRLAALLAD